jgi:hypothetical protein
MRAPLTATRASSRMKRSGWWSGSLSWRPSIRATATGESRHFSDERGGGRTGSGCTGSESRRG